MDRLVGRIPWRKVCAFRFRFAAGRLTLAENAPANVAEAPKGPTVPVGRICRR